MTKNKTYKLRLSEELLKKATELASKEENSLAAVIRRLLIEEIARAGG